MSYHLQKANYKFLSVGLLLKVSIRGGLNGEGSVKAIPLLVPGF